MRKLRVLLVANAFAGSTTSIFYVTSNSCLSENVKKKNVLKIKDEEVLLPSKLTSLVNDVMADMKLSNEIKSFIKPFLSKTLSPVYAGHVNLKANTWLGIPQNFILEHSHQVDFETMVDEVPANASDSAALKSSLILSDKAKKFMIAQQISEASSFTFFPIACLPMLVSGAINGVIIRAIYRPSKKMKSLRTFSMQTVAMGILLYLGISDVLNVYSQMNADFQAAKLGKSYAEGGLEYYGKIKERNSLIKKLNKNAKFTEDGEISSFSLNSIVPLKVRLEHLKGFLTKDQGQPSFWKYFFLSCW